MPSNPLLATFSEQEIQDLLVIHTSYATHAPDGTQKIADAHRLLQTLDPEIILTKRSGNTIKLRTFLTHFLQEAPNPAYVARALVNEYPPPLGSYNQLERIKFISTVWLNSFLFALKGVRHANPTPNNLSTPLTPSAELTDDLEAARRSQQILTDEILPRDGHRDVLFRKLSLKAPQPYTDFPQLTNSSHILPFALNEWSPDEKPPVEKKVLWDILVNWFGHDLSYLKGTGINRPGNAFTLLPSDHHRFGAFEIWFEPVEERRNCYYVRSRALHELQDQIIEFKNHSTKEIELPDSDLLRIHAAVARILHLSGAADVFDSMANGDGEKHVLRADGSSQIDSLVNSLWATGRALPVHVGA